MIARARSRDCKECVVSRKNRMMISSRLLVMFGFCALATASCGVFSPDGEGEAVRIEGRVYARCVGSGSGPCTNVEPVSGAVVSTSLDSTTTTTDASGAFDLKTSAAGSKGGCNVYTITITAAGHRTYSQAASWGTHPANQTFVLAEGWPNVFGSCS